MDPRKTSMTPPPVDESFDEEIESAAMESYKLQYNNSDVNSPNQAKRKADIQLGKREELTNPVISKSSSLSKIGLKTARPDKQSNENENSVNEEKDIKPLNHAHSSSEIVVKSYKPLIKDFEMKDSALRLGTITQHSVDNNKFIDILKSNYLEKLDDSSTIAMYSEFIEIEDNKAKVGNDELDGIFKFAIVRLNDHTIQLRLSRTLPAELMSVDDKSLDMKFKTYKKTIREQTKEIEGVSSRVKLPEDFVPPSPQDYKKLETNLLNTREKFIAKSFPLSEVEFLPVIAVGELVFNKGDISQIIEIEGPSFDYSTSNTLDRNEAYKQFPILSNALGNIKKSEIESSIILATSSTSQSTAKFVAPPQQVEKYKTIQLTVAIDENTYNSLNVIIATPSLSKSAQDPINKRVYMREMFVNKTTPYYGTIFIAPSPTGEGHLYYPGNSSGKANVDNMNMSVPLTEGYNFVVVKFKVQMENEVKHFVQLRVRKGGSHYLTSLDNEKVVAAINDFKTTGNLHFVNVQDNLLKEELDTKIFEFIGGIKFLENIDRFGLPVSAAGTINFKISNTDPEKDEFYINIDDQAGAFFVKKDISSYFHTLSLFSDIKKDLFDSEGKPIRFKSYTPPKKDEEEDKEENKGKKELNKLETSTSQQSYVPVSLFGGTNSNSNSPSSHAVSNLPPLSQTDIRDASSSESSQTTSTSSSSSGTTPYLGRTG